MIFISILIASAISAALANAGPSSMSSILGKAPAEFSMDLTSLESPCK